MRNVTQIVFTLNGKSQTLLLDTINPPTINSSSSVTRQPIVSGDTIADHMVRQPKSISITGTYSLHGANKGSSGGTLTDVQSANASKLSAFEELLEEIKDNACKCSIVTFSTENNSSMRFAKRPNMVLSQIQFTENVDSVDFSLGFVEAITTKTTSKTFATDNLLPEVSGEILPIATSVASVNYDDIEQAILYEIIYDALSKSDSTQADYKITGLENLSYNQLIAYGASQRTAELLLNGKDKVDIKSLKENINTIGSTRSGLLGNKDISSITLAILSWYKYSADFFAEWLTLISTGLWTLWYKAFTNEDNAKTYYIIDKINKLVLYLDNAFAKIKKRANMNVFALGSNINNSYCQLVINNSAYTINFTDGAVVGVKTGFENGDKSNFQNLSLSPSSWLECSTNQLLLDSGYYLYTIYTHNTYYLMISKITPKEFLASIEQAVIDFMEDIL